MLLATMPYSILCGDTWTILQTLSPESVQCVVTSPPYWGLRDYGLGPEGIGLEPTPQAYVASLVSVFREVRRVLRNDGVAWLNLGDCYQSGTRGGYSRARNGVNKNKGSSASDFTCAPNRLPQDGLKDKDLVGIPWRVAFALQDDGWYLRSDTIWAKSNPMPESVTDRPTRSHEYLFLLTKRAQYYYDHEAVQELAVQGNGTPFRNLRSVWTLPTQPYKGAHFAVFPEALVDPCIRAGSRQGDLVLDPFCGSGTVGVVSLRLGRSFLGIDLNPLYVGLAIDRLGQVEAP